MIELRVLLPLRGCDPGGDGAFGAYRGTRTHKGIDFAVAKSSSLISPISGYVTKLGYPYGDDLTYRYVQVQDKDKNLHRFFYVIPIVELGDEVFANETLLGTTQNVASRYPEYKGMKPHIHYEVKTPEGSYLNPEELWTS